VKEIVVLSGKGGTGKTSLAATFASMMSSVVIVDCDVDASNLHLLLNPAVRQSHDFRGGAKAQIDASICNGCGACLAACRFEAIRLNGSASVRLMRCEGCGVCIRRCPVDAISLQRHICGQWFISQTRFGAMIHAYLQPGEENSGKLVSVLRQSAKRLARQQGASWILADGPPGTGCPAISSLTGADYTVMIAEPSLSGFADLRRALGVADHFRIPAGIVINKADINAQIAARIEAFALESGRDFLGRIDYDPAFVRSQLNGVPVLEAASEDLRTRLQNIWRAIQDAVRKHSLPLAVLP